MIVTLDGQRLDDEFAADCTLQGLLDQVRSAHLPERVIISVARDGQQLDDETLKSGLGQPVAGDAQIDLESGDPRELVCEALRALALEFQQAGPRNAALADQFSAGETGAAVHGIGELIGLWQTCQHAIAQCSGMLGINLTACQHNGRSITAWLEDLIDKLTELRGALQAQDMVLLGDLLRYEFTPLCESWHALLDDLTVQVEATAATS